MYDCYGFNSGDETLNHVYYKYIQDQMIRALDTVTGYVAVIDKLKAGKPLLSDELEKMHECLDDFFPEGFDKSQMQDTMKELYFIITSEDRYIPNLVEEYVLAACIDVMEESASEDESFIDPMPRRGEVKKAIIEYFMDECGESEEEASEIAEDRIRGLEDFSGIIDYCFYDTDFMMLDDYAAEDIVRSGVNDELGVGALEPARKRMPDGSLQHIGESQKSESFTFRIKM